MADELLSEILNKLIDTQVQNAQVTADLKNAVEDNNDHLKELKQLLSEVNGHFSNGFRSEIKKSITDAADEIQNNIAEKAEQNKSENQKTLKVVSSFTSALKSPKSWIGAFLFVASILGTIVAIVTVILKLMGGA